MRTGWWLGVGGCLLGWEPEAPSGETGSDTSTSDPTSPTPCELPTGGELCSAYDARTVTISAGLAPEISSDRGISDLYVYQGLELQWHAWTSDYGNSLYSFTYGETPIGTTAGGPASPLVDGVEYEVQLDAACVDDVTCEVSLSSVYQTFVAGS